MSRCVLSRPDPTILVFDTSAAHCAAALLCRGRILALRYEEMTRGQAERLFPLLEEMMAETGTTWKDLDAMGIGIGPGNFTGIRIAVASARGLSLSLGIPAIGISTFEIAQAEQDIVRLPAPRGAAYAQRFRDGRPEGAPWLENSEEVSGTITTPDWNPEGLERLANLAQSAFESGRTHPRPAPLYIRAPDAAPSRVAPPVILP